MVVVFVGATTTIRNLVSPVEVGFSNIAWQVQYNAIYNSAMSLQNHHVIKQHHAWHYKVNITTFHHQLTKSMLQYINIAENEKLVVSSV